MSKQIYDIEIAPTKQISVGRRLCIGNKNRNKI